MVGTASLPLRARVHSSESARAQISWRSVHAVLVQSACHQTRVAQDEDGHLRLTEEGID